MACKLCGAIGPMIKAHIIPRSMYPFDQDWAIQGGAEKYMFMLGGPKRAITHTGDYDSDLVCKQCEASFSPWDTYAFELLKRSNSWKPMQASNGALGAWMHDDINYELLKLFLLSVVWRAHASNRPSVRSFSVGVHAGLLKRLVKKKIAGPAEQFPVFLYRYDVQDPLSTVVCLPVRCHIEKWRAVDMIFGGYRYLVGLPGAPPPSIGVDIVLRKGRPLIAMAANIRQQKVYHGLRKLVVDDDATRTTHRP